MEVDRIQRSTTLKGVNAIYRADRKSLLLSDKLFAALMGETKTILHLFNARLVELKPNGEST